MLPFLLIHCNAEFSYFGDNTITWKSQGGGGMLKFDPLKLKKMGLASCLSRERHLLPEDLICIPRTHILEEDNQLPKVVL